MKKEDVIFAVVIATIMLAIVVFGYYCLQMQYDCRSLAIIKGYTSSEVVAICK